MNNVHDANTTRATGLRRLDGSEPGANSLPLSGLRADNPLGFLAALGTLRTLDSVEPEPEWELHWDDCAILSCRNSTGNMTEEHVVETLEKIIGVHDPLFDLAEPWKGKESESYVTYGKFLNYVCTTLLQDAPPDIDTRRRVCDFASSLSCKNARPRKNADPIVKSMFLFMIGNTTYFRNAKALSAKIQNDSQTLHRSLFSDWDYSDTKLTIDLDPIALQRQQAKSIGNPSGKYNPTMHGANRLAVEGISLYPVLNTVHGVRTVGWDNDVFIWPVWSYPASLDEMRGILCTRYDKLTVEERERIGISALYKSTRRLIDTKGHRRMTTGCIC